MTVPASASGIRNRLSEILAWCEKQGLKLDYPGEGDERPFRGRLASAFLSSILGWPEDRVVLGERFDIRLIDSQGFVVATIETKKPNHEASEREKKDFLARLDGYGSLRVAYMTNGSQWRRVDLVAPKGNVAIAKDWPILTLQYATDEELEAFFSALRANRYVVGVNQDAKNRLSVTSSKPHVLVALASDLETTVGRLTEHLVPFFSDLRSGAAGQTPSDIAMNLFYRWCDQSLIPTPSKTAGIVASLAPTGRLDLREVTRELNSLRFAKGQIDQAVASIARLPAPSQANTEQLSTALWPCYEPWIRTLAAQTAHLVLGRALLYRIGEDQALFPEAISGRSLTLLSTQGSGGLLASATPVTSALDSLRRSLSDSFPTVYSLGEFDWWLVPENERARLTPEERAWLNGEDRDWESCLLQMLNILDAYHLAEVNVDVWRNVYEKYLPAEERQRLGGFYTLDELVGLVLDISGFTSETPELCQLTFIDPACGSGAFVVGALSRLLEHLRLPMRCHSEINDKRLPEWQRLAMQVDLVSDRLHAVDIHPFAAFLTTINVFFLLLPMYARIRQYSPQYSIDIGIFTADSLDVPGADLQADLFERLNSRVQRAADSFQRYQSMLSKRFDRVFGNPPWGTVMKGRLAPIYDKQRKEHLKSVYPNAARGKYDIYGLFMERSLQLLTPNGRMALVTQDTYLDKEWASGLRTLIAKSSRVRAIVDLNPFGNLLFHAMNTPCVTVADAQVAQQGSWLAVSTTAPREWPSTSAAERRRWVVETVRRVTADAGDSGDSQVAFASACQKPLDYLADAASAGWSLSPDATGSGLTLTGTSIADLLDVSQGVTPGGALDIFLMSTQQATELQLEEPLIMRAVKSRESARWRMEWKGRVFLYPYHRDKGAWVPAFSLDYSALDSEHRTLFGGAGIADALDFDRSIDDYEREQVAVGITDHTALQLLNHRTGQNLVRYPHAGRYLVNHYVELEGRVFKHMNIRRFKRRWYEYLWPRDQELIMRTPRLFSPTLIRSEARFALDEVGYLSDHAGLYLRLRQTQSAKVSTVRSALEASLHRPASDRDVLLYCLAILNSDRFYEWLTRNHQPTPKGAYTITEKVLAGFPVPTPPETAGQIVDAANRLVAGDASTDADTALNALVAPLF